MAYALPLEAVERHIVESCQAGERDAFESLYREFAPSLRTFCRRRLRDASLAEDACHETLLKARAAMGRFQTGTRVWPWLATIAARVCIDIQRERSREIATETLVQPSEASIEELVAKRSDSDLISQALRSIPDRYRAPVYLRDLEGWSYEQISALTGATVPAVRTALMRGRRALRSHIEQLVEAQGGWGASAVVPALWLRFRHRLRRWAAPLQARAGQLWWADPAVVMGPLANGVAGAAIAILALSTTGGAAQSVTVTQLHASSAAAAGAHAGGPGSGQASAPPSGSQSHAGASSVTVRTPAAVPVAVSATASRIQDRGGSGRTVYVNVARAVPGDDGSFGVAVGFDCESAVRAAVCAAYDAAPQLP
jgi:RNA polymerase sigma-70 factor (ECF subfamily)